MAKWKTVPAVVVCDSDDEEIHVPQARSLHVSRDGRRVVETPRSPQKQAAAPQPSPPYEWNPSVERRIWYGVFIPRYHGMGMEPYTTPWNGYP